MATTGSHAHMSELYEKDLDGSGCRKMKRFRLTHNQSRYLMSEFARQAHPDAAHRERLSREIPGLSPRQVQVWFQNRRAKLKRMSSDDRYHMMKSRALPEEFPILQTLYSYDLTCASKTRASRSDSTCSSSSDQRDHSVISPQNSSQPTNRFSMSDSCPRDCQSDSSGRSCEVSPTSPCTTLPHDGFSRRGDPSFRTLQEAFSSPSTASVGSQPFGSYFEQVSTYRASGYVYPNCPVSECRSTKSVGELWQSRDDAQSMQMFPTWRPTLDTSFRSDARQESISPQSCSSTTSESYLPDNISSQRYESNNGGSHVFSFNNAPRIVPLSLSSEPMLNMYDTGQSISERKGHESKRSLSQPNVDIRT